MRRAATEDIGIKYLSSSANEDVFPEGQPANDGNSGIRIFRHALENADNIGGDCFKLRSRRHGAE